MAKFHPDASYYVPAHLERAGPFNPERQQRLQHRASAQLQQRGADVAFGIETQPGHGASTPRRVHHPSNNIGGVNVDSVGGTTYGGTGVYGAQIGGVWDALLGEGRNWWFFASSDWHNRGMFGPDDRRSSQDFYPGEYQRDYTMVRNGSEHRSCSSPRRSSTACAAATISPPAGSSSIASRSWPAFGSKPAPQRRSATRRLEADGAQGRCGKNDGYRLRRSCATMGEKLVVPPGRTSWYPSSCATRRARTTRPTRSPIRRWPRSASRSRSNAPVLDHVDVIRGMVTGSKQPGAADYAGEWPRNWIAQSPDARQRARCAPGTRARRSSRRLPARPGRASPGNHREFKKMTFRIRGVKASQYLRLRGTNLPAQRAVRDRRQRQPAAGSVHERRLTVSPTQAGGTDGFAANNFLRIPCTAAGTTCRRTA